jgi:peroxiredoxin
MDRLVQSPPRKEIMGNSVMADEIRDSLSSRKPLPERVAATFKGEQTALQGQGLPRGLLGPPAPMPDGELIDVEGNATSLARVRDDGPATVVLYRGAWCPYCNVALRVYDRDLVEPLAAEGVRLIAISPQKPDGSLTIHEAHNLRYAVLSDPGNQIASQLGVLTAPSDATLSAQAELGLDLAQVNADGTPGLPMPTVVLVDAAGDIAWLDVQPNYAARTEPDAILAAVARLL